MHEDEQGFLYPVVDVNACINCHLCEKICPVIHQQTATTPIKVFAAKNKDAHICNNSSSGGVFYILAKYIIENNGVVFGAKYDENCEVRHDYTDTIEGISEFQTSKYLQSIIGNSFILAEKFLKEGKKVLFSGTPCQIAGLLNFLKKDYSSQLLTVDIVCHGVPSPLIFRDYLTSLKHSFLKTYDGKSHHDINDVSIDQISFRDKKFGWEKYGFSVRYSIKDISSDNNSTSLSKDNTNSIYFFELSSNNIYMRGFLHDLYLRPSCYNCPTKCGKSHSDITIGDFWGVQNEYPELYTQGLYSLVFANSNFGLSILKQPSLQSAEVSFDNAQKWNPAIYKTATKTQVYNKFWEQYSRIGIAAIEQCCKKQEALRNKKSIFRLFKPIARICRSFLTTKGL